MYDPNDDLLKLSDFTLIIKKALDNSFDTSKNSPYSTTKISKWPALFKENEVQDQWPDLEDFVSSIKLLAQLNPNLEIDKNHDYEKDAKALKKLFSQI